MRKPRIAVLFPSFLGGGAEAVCLWMLEGLKEEYDLTLFTFTAIDFRVLNRFYGTQLSTVDTRVLCPLPFKIVSRVFTNSASAYSLRQHLLLRHFKGVRHKFDLSISAFNEMDMGSPGIQYIHFPIFGRGHEPTRRIVGFPDSPLRRIYRNICRIISNFSEDMMRKNITVTNSLWTAGIIKRIYDIDAHVLHPPVSSNFPDIPWEDKENGFVCIARIVPEKKLEKAIRILQMLREQNFDIHLHILSGGCDLKYKKYIQSLYDKNASWVSLKNELHRKAFCRMLAKHKYGIHVRENEMFGIGIAEMVKAGCIPFVPSKGGQIEIIGGDKQLTFNNEHEAVEKISKVLSSRKTQDHLRFLLLERRDLFSEDRFNTKFRKLVRECLERDKGR